MYVRYRGVAGGCDSIMPSEHATICSGNAPKSTSLLDEGFPSGATASALR